MTFIFVFRKFTNAPKDLKQEMYVSLFHRAFRFTKFYLYQRTHLFLSYTEIT